MREVLGINVDALNGMQKHEHLKRLALTFEKVAEKFPDHLALVFEGHQEGPKPTSANKPAAYAPSSEVEHFCTEVEPNILAALSR